jgi:Peptidase M50B-like
MTTPIVAYRVDDDIDTTRYYYAANGSSYHSAPPLVPVPVSPKPQSSFPPSYGNHSSSPPQNQQHQQQQQQHHASNYSRTANNVHSNCASAGGKCCESALMECGKLPDACTNEIREENLIQRQQRPNKDKNNKSNNPSYYYSSYPYGDPDNINDHRTPAQRFIDRERNLLIACVVLVIALNISTGRYVLYPFMILSTWVHEMCHGLAAILMGGYISKLEIFKDGSGLAYTAVNTDWKRGFVASAGYPGTSVVGCLLLLFRRTTLGPTIGTITLGIIMILSCILWVRNTWGLVVLLLQGVALVVFGWRLPAVLLDNLYAFMACTCCLNAFESISELFASQGEYYVGGEVVTTTDAHTVAEMWGMEYYNWAILWLFLSLIMSGLGIVFAFDAKRFKTIKKVTTATTNNNTIIDAEVVPVYPTESSSQQQYHYFDPQQHQTTTATTLPTIVAQPYGGECNNKSTAADGLVSTSKAASPKRKWFRFGQKK